LLVSGQGGATLEVSDRTLTRRAVRVKSHHGPLQVNTKGVSIPSEKDEHKNERFPIVELGGVNGQCEVSIADTQSGLPQDDWSSCLMHLDSLSPDSVSLVVVDRGDVSVTVDRKVESDLRLLSMTDGESLVETGALLAEEEDEEMVANVLKHLETSEASNDMPGERIVTKTKAFTAKETGFQTAVLE